MHIIILFLINVHVSLSNACFCVTEECFQLSLASHGHKFFKREIKKDRKIKSMKLLKKHSRSACDLGKSFGFKDTEAFVDKGCRGQFNICVDTKKSKILFYSCFPYRFLQ